MVGLAVASKPMVALGWVLLRLRLLLVVAMLLY
jgi:hypothetical protein